MAYVPVPKDLTAVKTKVLLNLTKRQILCFGAGALIGIPLFFLLKSSISISGASISMVVVMLPFFLLAMYEKNGQPLEKIVRNIVRVCFLRPKKRPYQTNNYYTVLMRQHELDKEVNNIVHNSKGSAPPKGKENGRGSVALLRCSDKSRTAADRSRGRKGKAN